MELKAESLDWSDQPAEHDLKCELVETHHLNTTMVNEISIFQNHERVGAWQRSSSTERASRVGVNRVYNTYLCLLESRGAAELHRLCFQAAADVGGWAASSPVSGRSKVTERPTDTGHCKHQQRKKTEMFSKWREFYFPDQTTASCCFTSQLLKKNPKYDFLNLKFDNFS